MISAIIIDDEEKSRKLLRNLVNAYCKNIEVVMIADSVHSGVAAIRQYKPDLVFLDIVMPNADGFELLAQIKDINCEIIFTTAFNQYAIKAIKVCVLDYLLKPIDVEELQEAVEKAQKKIQEKKEGQIIDKRLDSLLENVKSEPNRPQKIGFPMQNGVMFFNIQKILACKAEGNYTTIFFDGKDKIELVSKTLKEFEELLIEYNFIRTHRSYLVNLNHLKEYRRYNNLSDDEGEGGYVIVSNNMKVPVSREKRKELLSRISRPF